MFRNCEFCGKRCDFRWASCPECRDARDDSYRRMPAHVALGIFLGLVGLAAITVIGLCLSLFMVTLGFDPRDSLVLGVCMGGVGGGLCCLAGLSSGWGRPDDHWR